jgi:hypothetical protein
MPQQAYSPKETAKRLSVGERVVWKGIANGTIRSVKVSERRRAITDVEIARILQHGIDGP